MAYTRFASQVLADAAPAAGAAAYAPEFNIGSGTIVRGLWVYTTIGASGFAGTPAAGGRIVVNVYPRGIAASGATSKNFDNDVLFSFEHEVTRDGAYEWADYCEGSLPRYTKVGVVNLTGQNVAASQLDVSLECVKETA
jgi:hypothetical protein